MILLMTRKTEEEMDLKEKMPFKSNVLIEFHSSGEASRSRKKIDVDGFRLIESAKDGPLLREEEKKPEGLESKYDLRKSLAWDSAFFTSPGVLDPEELFETLNFHEGEIGDCKSEVKEANALSCPESLAASRIGECIARRSLAWDSAFFTSAGVLDPDELSMVNKGYKKSEPQPHLLPGIEEEFWKSADSNSTIDSDYSLASLELGLFHNMRSSIQNSSRPYRLVNSSSNLRGVTGTGNRHSSKRPDTASRFQVKPLPSSRSQTISSHGVGKIAKEAMNLPRAQHATQSGEHASSSSLKMLKTSSQANPLSTAATKRSSLGASHLKMENKTTKAASGQILPKKPCLVDSGSVIPNSTPPPEPASSRLRIASTRSACSQSTPTFKSPNLLRRKNDSAACDSCSKTPSQVLNRSKDRLLDSPQPTYLQSTPNSSCTSLSSSIDCWSSESSTSGSGIAFRRGIPLKNDASNTDNRACDQPFVRNNSKKTRLSYQEVERVSKGTSPLPQAISREIKPSGLRMPSPKIGFFDVEKSRPLTPNGGLKFHSGIQGTSNKVKNGKLQQPRTLTRTGNSKEKRLSPSQENGNQIFKDIKPDSPVQLEGEKGSQEFAFSKISTSSQATRLKAIEPNGLGSFSKTEIGAESRGHAIANQVVKKSCLNQNEDSGARSVENELHSGDKENLFSFENQVADLSKQIEAIDFRGDLVMEF